MSEPTIAQLKNVISDLEDKVDALTRHANGETKKRESAETKLADTTKRLHSRVLDSEFSRIAHSLGFPAEAVPDAMGHVQANWTVGENGEPVLKNANGIDDPSPERWMAEQAKTRFAYMFRGGQGGQQQAGGGSSGGFSGERNPWLKESWDDMAQVAIIRANPDKAKQLAAAAGSKIGALDPNLAPTKPAY